MTGLPGLLARANRHAAAAGALITAACGFALARLLASAKTQAANVCRRHAQRDTYNDAMEYLDGLTLEDLVQRCGPLPEGRVVRILEQICGSLAEAHGIGLIHRDIKPANIILSHRGGVPDLVKVLDFGLVKSLGAEHEANVTAANALTGTPLYLAPESIDQPDTIDARADIYAIGAVGYFLLTGTPVFNGKSIVEICMHHVRTPPEPPSQRLGRAVAPQLEAVILQCLAKDRAARPASARVIQEMLRSCALAEAWSDREAEAWWLHFRNQTVVAATASTDISPVGVTVAYPSKKEVGNETAPGNP